MDNIIVRGKQFVHCKDVVHSSEGPFLEVLLYSDFFNVPNCLSLHRYALMEKCWKIKPEDRPAFSELVAALS